MNEYKYIVCNWKLNGNKKLLDFFLEKLNKEKINFKKIKILISPPIIYLDYANEIFKTNININICSQNISDNINGSFTGETSAYMLNDIGIKYSIIGHSERRYIYKESNDKIIKKFIISKENNIIPILCIGEDKNDFLNKKSLSKCINQIKLIIKHIGIKNFYGSIIAYEPIWSIGTNVVDYNHTEYVINSIIKYLIKIDKNIINNINFLYGGSISSDNIINFLKIKNINGFLIGKNSLILNEVLSIINKINLDSI